MDTVFWVSVLKQKNRKIRYFEQTLNDEDSTMRTLKTYCGGKVVSKIVFQILSLLV